jgi:hypothetical protein
MLHGLPVRLVLWTLLATALLAPVAAAHGGAHSPNVEDAHHLPPAPTSRQDVSIHVLVRDDTKVTSVTAVYCRVERYACGPAINMTRTSPNVYDGVIPWHKEFFRDVTMVGYRFELRYIDGTNETTPLMHYPARPRDLPAGADTYYYYTLTIVEEAPSPNLGLVATALLVFVAWRRTR